MGRPDWTVDAPEHVVREAAAMLDAGQTAGSVFRRLDLSRYAVDSTFRAWALRRKKVAAQQQAGRNGLEAHSTGSGKRATDPRAIFETAIGSLAEALAAGELKPNQVIGAISVLRDVLKLEEVEKPASERAEEKHEQWRAEMAAKTKKAVDERTEGGKTLTREDVYDLVDQVMRGG